MTLRRIELGVMSNLLDPHDRLTWDELVVRSRREREALGCLYDQIYPAIFRYCVRRTGNRSLGEDVTSTVFLNVANHIVAFTGSSYSEFRRWVFVIATNELNAALRKSSRRRTLLAKGVESGQLAKQADSVCSESALESRSTQAAILRLNERDQSVITLRFFAELPYEEIGKILNISAGAARTATSRALLKMKHELERLE
jgi:RNA polymerase sigma factor (sigma-70 family)